MDEKLKGEDQVEKISALNIILENLVSDASDLVKDLYWGVKNYLLFGLISFLFGIQTIIANIDVLQGRLYVPLFVGGVLIFSGIAQIISYVRLRKKYGKLFSVQNELKKP